MLTIRLQRTGGRNKSSFRIVLAEAQKSASKKFQEVLGFYSPRLKSFGIKDEERLKYWLGQNIKLSPTVHNLLITKKILTAEKIKAWKPKKQPATPEAMAATTQPQAVATATEEAKSADAPPTSEAVGVPTENVGTGPQAHPAQEAAWAEAPKQETPPPPETAA